VLAKFKGFSLVELLIALLLGSVLITMVISLYVSSVSVGAKNLKYSRLRADLQSIALFMEMDIRRAGYGGSEFMVASGASKTIDIANNHCIVYSYKHSSTSNENKMGFRLSPSKDAIQFGTGVDPLAINCYSSGYWQAISDNEFIKITQLDFMESEVSSALTTMRSVQIDIKGELLTESEIEYSIRTRVQVRNLEFN
jgi:prepilin-type N-terminal cleavage/methylation domain-containing protein